MTRQTKFPPTINHHKPSGRDRIRVNGKDIYLGPHGSKEAQAKYAEIISRMTQGLEPIPESRPREIPILTVADVITQWWVHELGRRGENDNEMKQYKIALRVLDRLFGTIPASDFTSIELMQIQDAMLSGSWVTKEEMQHSQRRRAGASWSRKVCNRQIRRIRTVWRWAESRQLVLPGSWHQLQTVQPIRIGDHRARETKPVQPVLFQVVKEVARCASMVVRDMLLLQWHTGMRSGEVRLMQRHELDTSGPIWLYRPGQHKNAWRGQARVIALGARCQTLLKPYLDREGYLFTPSGGKNPCYSTHGYAQAVRYARQKAGHPDFHAYRIRHTWRMRVGSTMGDEAARASLGHSTIETTAHYGTLDEQKAIEVAKRMG